MKLITRHKPCKNWKIMKTFKLMMSLDWTQLLGMQKCHTIFRIVKLQHLYCNFGETPLEYSRFGSSTLYVIVIVTLVLSLHRYITTVYNIDFFFCILYIYSQLYCTSNNKWVSSFVLLVSFLTIVKQVKTVHRICIYIQHDQLHMYSRTCKDVHEFTQSL